MRNESPLVKAVCLPLTLAALLAACSRSNTERTQPQPTIAPSPAASVRVAPQAPTPVRVRPLAVFASAYIDDDHGKADLPELAFDDDPKTAWQCTASKQSGPPWLEARLPPNTHVDRVVVSTGYDHRGSKAEDLFVLNAHAKTLAVYVDEHKAATRAVAPDERSVTVAVQKSAARLRFVLEELYPGSKWKDDVVLPTVSIFGVLNQGDAPSAKEPQLSPFFEELFRKGASWTYKGKRTTQEPADDTTSQLKNVDTPISIRCTVEDTAVAADSKLSRITCTNAPPWFPAQGLFLAGESGLRRLGSNQAGAHLTAPLDGKMAALLSRAPVAIDAQPKRLQGEDAELVRKSTNFGNVPYAAWCRKEWPGPEGELTAYCFADGLPLTEIVAARLVPGTTLSTSYSAQLADVKANETVVVTKE